MKHSETPRCAAAHPDDPTPCEGPHAAVTVRDAGGTGADGCVHHGARLLASVTGARVAPGPDGPEGAAIAAYWRAQELPAFVWWTGWRRAEDLAGFQDLAGGAR